MYTTEGMHGVNKMLQIIYTKSMGKRTGGAKKPGGLALQVFPFPLLI